MIKAIVFDYGGVIELKEGSLSKLICDYLNIGKESFLEAYFSFNHLVNTGVKTRLEVYELVVRKLGFGDEQVKEVSNIIEKRDQTKFLNLELIEIIKDLKKRGYKVAILSNYSVALRQKLIDEGLHDLFDEIVISAEVGFQKPQPEIFDILFKKLGLASHEIIFVDDTKQSLLGHENIGYKPIHFVGNEQFKSDLNKILLQ